MKIEGKNFEYKNFKRIVFITLVTEGFVLYGALKLFLSANAEWKFAFMFLFSGVAIVLLAYLWRAKWIPSQSEFINAYLFYVIEKWGISTFVFLRNLSILSLISWIYLFVILHQKQIYEWHWQFSSYGDIKSILAEIFRLFDVWPGPDKWPYVALVLAMTFLPLLRKLSSLIRKYSGITLGVIFLCFVLFTAWPPGSAVNWQEMVSRIIPLMATPLIVLFPFWVSKLPPVEEGAADRRFIENYIHRDFEPKKWPAVWSIEWVFYSVVEVLLSFKNKKYWIGFSELYRVFNLWNARRQEARRITTDSIRYLDDFPIQWAEDDEMGNRRISYELFKHIRSTDLKEAKWSTIIGLDGKRGTWKTSILNILKNDYIRFWEGNLSLLKFMAWAYPSGSLLEAFLSDFAKHCEKQGINVGEDLEKYAQSLSGAHWGFKAIESLVGKKTFSERIEIISDRLRRAEKKIVVVLDDLDRLSKPEDFEAVLKLLRSVADFPWIIYIIGYSQADMVKRWPQWETLMEDFWEKFLNWKLTTSSHLLSGKNVLSEYLEKHLLEETENLLEHSIKNSTEALNEAWKKFGNEMPPSKWKSPDRLEDFTNLYEAGSTASFRKYVISAVKQRIWDLRSEYKDLATLRFVKSFMNETLRSLSDTWTMIELFLNDVRWIICRSQEDGDLRGTLYEELGVENVNTLYLLLCGSYRHNYREERELSSQFDRNLID